MATKKDVEKDADLKGLGFVVDVSLYTVGDVMDLSNEKLPIADRLEILQHGIVEGDLRSLPMNKLPEFIQAISEALSAEANPT